MIVTLFLVPFLIKSAVGPFFMWPAMAHAEAPDDFSAFLSGVMIKYGAYGIILFILPVFSGYSGISVGNTPLYLYVLAWTGALTAVWGTLHAIRENDMKRLMAYSTVGNLGYVVLALSMNTSFGIAAALFHVFNHMVFKGTIFLTLAAVKFRTGEREMHRLGGLAYRMPLTFFAFLISIISAAAIPPMAGFGSKWMIYQTLFHLYRGLHAIFLGQLRPVFKDIKEAPFLQSLPMVLLMLVSFAVGAFPGLFLKPVNRAVFSQFGGEVDMTMTTIQGFTGFVNLLAVSLVFIGAFLFTLLLYAAGKSRKKVEALDNYMAGESPEDWNLTPEQYQHAYRFYEPWEKMFNPLLESRVSSLRWFDVLSYNFRKLSRSVRLFSSGSQLGVVLPLILLVAVIALGVWVW